MTLIPPASALTLPAPAKLNLFLHITGRRDDGYHQLQTVFALLDHGDTLAFTPADTLSLQCDHSGDHDFLPTDDSNLILQAARALQAHTGSNKGAAISLTKRLPLGGGLGGGSSNAATALLGLNQLWALGLTLPELAEIGLTLGADVPVFVLGHSAWAEGVGERISPVTLPNDAFLVVYPGIHVSTARIFGDRELTRDTPISKLPASLETVLIRDFHNDCEAVATRQFPQIGKTLDWLKQRTGNARMTGTGACCFSRLTGLQQGQQLLQQLPQHWTGFVARSCNISPLHQTLGMGETLAKFRETKNSGKPA